MKNNVVSSLRSKSSVWGTAIMEQLREMDSISLVTIPVLRAGYYRSLPLIVQPAIHTNNR